MAEALWARMCEGKREDGSIIEPNDPIWTQLNSAGKAAKIDPQEWLNQSDLYGDLHKDERFCQSFEGWLKIIWAKGTEAALEAYLKE